MCKITAIYGYCVAAFITLSGCPLSGDSTYCRLSREKSCTLDYVAVKMNLLFQAFCISQTMPQTFEKGNRWCTCQTFIPLQKLFLFLLELCYALKGIYICMLFITCKMVVCLFTGWFTTKTSCSVLRFFDTTGNKITSTKKLK